MAFKPVVLTKEEEEAMAAGGDFYKFTAIGQKLLGRFPKTQPQTGPHAKANRVDYVFRMAVKNEATGAMEPKEVPFTPPTKAAQLLEKAMKGGLLKPNYVVKLSYTADLDVGKESPMKIFELEIDDAPAPAKAAAPPPPPPPDDDLPF